MRTLITIALLVATAAALAGEPSTSAYAGQEARTIKALSAEDIELIDAEARLDGLFASKQIDAQALSASRSCKRNSDTLTCRHISSRPDS